MRNCPFCQALLEDAEVVSGECPRCHRRLAEAGAEQGVTPVAPPDPADAAGQAAKPSSEAAAPEAGPASDYRVAATIESTGSAAPPPEESDEGTADDRRVAQTIELWDGNVRAREGMVEASLAYATSAFQKGDYDLGASLLDPDIPDHAELLERIREAQREREARQHRLKLARRVGLALAATVFLVVTVAFFWIRAEASRARRAEGVANAERRTAEIERARAVQQKEIAEQQRQKAEAARAEAERQRAEAVGQEQRAEAQRQIAVQAQHRAEEAQKQEEYEAYIARIGLAAAKIEENAFDEAASLLEDCPARLRHWEWGRLKHLCRQSVRSFDTGEPVEAVALAPDGKRFVTGGWCGVVQIWDLASGRQTLAIDTGAEYVFAVGFSPDGR